MIKSIVGVIGDLKNSDYLIFLLGNKIDLINNQEKTREITIEEAKKICEANNLVWGGEVSVKDFEVEKFNVLVKDFVEKLYKKIGDKSNNAQVSKKLGSAKKKKKRRCF